MYSYWEILSKNCAFSGDPACPHFFSGGISFVQNSLKLSFSSLFFNIDFFFLCNLTTKCLLCISISVGRRTNKRPNSRYSKH